ncbi:MAG: hypothetical protein IPK86_00825 [Neisseriales bacterium]|nr:MAG: hypothetical protein IPK86_00825 [Neisseriales bacterium]
MIVSFLKKLFGTSEQVDKIELAARSAKNCFKEFFVQSKDLDKTILDTYCELAKYAVRGSDVKTFIEILQELEKELANGYKVEFTPIVLRKEAEW